MNDGKDVEGSGHSIIKILSQHFPGGTEEIYDTPPSG
jgi:hypothetical protein